MLAIRNLEKKKFRTFLTIMGIALGVISIILLASIGNGLLSTGGKLLEQSTIHLWVTGGATDLSSQYSGSGGSKISDAHKFVEEFRKDKDIKMVTPVLTEMVYAFKNNSEPRAVFGLGIEGSGGTMVDIIQGKDLIADKHYNKGKYDGEWNKNVLIDNRTASLLDVRVGDTILIGKTLPKQMNSYSPLWDLRTLFPGSVQIP
jgi:putative ABC transport system permease protein